MEANLVPVGQHAAHNGNSAIAQFFINVKILANHDKEQAAILFGMLFTLIIWVIAALSLIMAALSYILFLWHYIPSSDGGLSGYCRRKVDSRLQRIVGVKINTALAKGNITRMRDDVKAASIGEHPTRVVRQPTLPILETKTEDKLPEMPLSRQTTQSTLPAYTSRVPSRDGSYSNSAVDKESVMPDTFPLHSRPMGPSRSTTHSSAWSDASVASNAPLIREAAEMGYGHPARSYSPAPMSRKASDYSIVAGRPKMSRNLTGSSQNSYSPAWNPPRAPGRTTPGRTTPGSLQTRPPVLQSAFGDDLGIHELPNCSPNQQSVRTHASPEVFEAKSQARTPEEYEMHPQRPIAQRGQSESIGEYVAFNPSIYHADSRQAPLPMSQSTSQPRPARNFTMPTRLHQNANLQAGEFILPQRSGTAPIPQDIPYNRIPPQRSGTAPICRDYTYGQTTSNRFFASDNEVSLQDSHAL